VYAALSYRQYQALARVLEALSYYTSVCGLKLRVYAALRYRQYQALARVLVSHMSLHVLDALVGLQLVRAKPRDFALRRLVGAFRRDCEPGRR
jgi:hypothetical protein